MIKINIVLTVSDRPKKDFFFNYRHWFDLFRFQWQHEACCLITFISPFEHALSLYIPSHFSSIFLSQVNVLPFDENIFLRSIFTVCLKQQAEKVIKVESLLNLDATGKWWKSLRE